MQGFFLGLAGGFSCLAYCLPSLFPLLLGEAPTARQTARFLLYFLTGRLLAYTAVSAAAFSVGYMLPDNSSHLLSGLLYIVFALLLFLYGLQPPKHTCPQRHAVKYGHYLPIARLPVLLPIAAGFIGGFNLCPPLILLFREAAMATSIFHSMASALTFLLGTAIYFLPLLGVGLIKHTLALQTIGRLTAMLVAVYYAYTGILLIIGGTQF